MTDMPVRDLQLWAQEEMAEAVCARARDIFENQPAILKQRNRVLNFLRQTQSQK